MLEQAPSSLCAGYNPSFIGQLLHASKSALYAFSLSNQVIYASSRYLLVRSFRKLCTKQTLLRYYFFQIIEYSASAAAVCMYIVGEYCVSCTPIKFQGPRQGLAFAQTRPSLSRMRLNRGRVWEPEKLHAVFHYTVSSVIINPRRACAARITVVVLCVCPSVCLRLFSHYRLLGGL